MSGEFEPFSVLPSGPPRHQVDIEPDNDADLPHDVLGLLVTVTGDVAFVTIGGETQTYGAVPAFTYLVGGVRRVLETTTATVKGLY